MNKLRFWILALISLAGLTASAQVEVDYTNPKYYEIAGISVEGAEFTDRNIIILQSGLAVGEEIAIPGQSISTAIKNLWNRSLYADIEIEVEKIVDGKIFLLIKVVERPRISGIKFKGVTSSQRKDILEKIFFVTGTIFTPEKERRANRIIRNYFVEKGFLNTKVNIFAEEDSTFVNGLTIKIEVDKGQRTKIHQIIFDGNQEFSSNKLRSKVKEFKEKRIWRVWSRSKFLPKKIETAKSNIVQFYNDNGYRDAEITFDTVYAYDDKSVDVEFHIYEGNQYYIRSIEWVGAYKYSPDTLQRILNIEAGDIYNASQLSRRLNGDPSGLDVASLYLDEGHLFFNLEPVEVKVENDSIDLQIRVYEGPQATIRKVIVEGNTKTSDYVILRELRTLPGQKFSRSDLIRSQREILNLGFFNQETLNVIPIPNPQDGSVDIKYIVEEKPSDQLQVQGGWGGRVRNPQTGQVIGGGFVGTVQLVFNNFSTKRFFKREAWRPVPSGDAQKLSLSVQMNGVGFQNYAFSFLEPWVGGKKPNSLGASVNYTINRNPNTDFQMNIFGTSLDYGKRLKVPDDFFRSYTSLGYKYYALRNAQSFFGGIDFDTGFINILSLKQTFDRTSIDAPLFPRSGSQFTLSTEVTPPYSLFTGKDYTDVPDAEKFNLLEFHKWTFNATWYQSVFKNLVVRPRIQAGFLGAYNSSYGISPFERFNMGGSGFGAFNFFGQEFISLRGYPDNSIGPRINPNDAGSQTVGGSIYNKYSLELRYPLTLNQAAPIWVVGFLEGGNSWLDWKEYNPFDLKRSAGVGIRVVVPMIGLLGVDWGYGFDPIHNSISTPAGGNFNFVIGQEF